MTGYCRDCFTGTVEADAAPLGTEQTLHGLPTYVTYSPSNSNSNPNPNPNLTTGVIVIITDAFGWTFLNTRTLADAYAARANCTVYIPDFMNGTALPVSVLRNMEYAPPITDLLPLRVVKRAWALAQTIPAFARFAVGSRHSVAQKRIREFLGAVHANPIPNPNPNPGGGGGAVAVKVGVVGFCWGGRFVIELTHDIPENKLSGENGTGTGNGNGKGLITCAFTAHPSLVTIPGDLEEVVLPLSVANGEDDEWMGKEKFDILKRVLEGKNEAAAAAGNEAHEVHEVVVYPGAKHGFAVRRDWTEERQKEIRDRCEDQAVAWFRRHLVDV